MMKLLQSPASNSCLRYAVISRAFRFWLYSTGTVTSSASKDTLYGRLLVHGKPWVSIVPILDQWVEEGRRVNEEQLWILIRKLRKFRRFNHALQVSEWMSNKRYFVLSPAAIAVRLDLISKVRGLDEAEKYFNNIPISLRGIKVYGSLLNCYAQSESLEKAEATMQNMREQGFAKKSLSYNIMLNLYTRMGKHEKLDPLLQEMEENGVPCDKFTFNSRLHAYVLTSDIKGMEKFLMKMEANPALTREWNAYVVAANGYLKAGEVENAKSMLKKSEQLVKPNKKCFAYEVLLTLYASLGDKNEVYRLWNLYKRTGKMYNTAYLSMISSLSKLDDLDGAEKILDEWEAQKIQFDFRIPYVLINAYCKKGSIVKAESLVNRLVESGKELNSGTWERLAALYHEDDQMDRAVEMMKKSILTSSPPRKPNFVILGACFEYLKGRIDVAEELIELLRENGLVARDTCVRLVNFVKNRDTALKAIEILEEDNQGWQEKEVGSSST